MTSACRNYCTSLFLIALNTSEWKTRQHKHWTFLWATDTMSVFVFVSSACVSEFTTTKTHFESTDLRVGNRQNAIDERETQIEIQFRICRLLWPSYSCVVENAFMLSIDSIFTFSFSLTHSLSFSLLSELYKLLCHSIHMLCVRACVLAYICCLWNVDEKATKNKIYPI